MSDSFLTMTRSMSRHALHQQRPLLGLWVKRALFGGLLLSLSACGDDPPARSSTRGIPAHLRRGGGTSAAAGAGAGAAAATTAASASPAALPEKLRRQELLEASGWSSSEAVRAALEGNLRDPFLPDLPELQLKQDVRADRAEIERRLRVTLPLSPRELELQAVITGTAVHQAMLSDSSGLGHFVRVGDIIGKSPDFVRVAQITSTEVVFEPIFKLEGGSEADREELLRKRLSSGEPTAGGLDLQAQEGGL